jgi:hypothetical protein
MSMGNEQFMSQAEEEFASAPSSFEPQEQQAPEQQPQQQEAEPFEGFSQLPESARAKFTETWEQAKKFEQELDQQRRQYGALSGRVPALQRELAELKKRTAAAPSSAQQKPMSAEAWEKFKADFPQDAAAFEQALARQAGELTGKLDPLTQELNQLKEWREEVQQQMLEAENEQIREELTEIVPDWRIIAGFEDADGNDIAPDANGRTQMHPEFKAWFDSNPQWMKDAYMAAMNSRDPESMAGVFGAFKRDYYDALMEEQRSGSQQQQPTQRRRVPDVMPSATSNALGGGLTGNHREDEFANTVTSDLWQQWQALKLG